MRRPSPILLVVTAALLGLTGCAAGTGSAPSGSPAPHHGTAGRPSAGTTTAAVRELPTSGVPDYQLGGAYTPPAGVTVVERDSTARPAPGTYGICYVNGFQTQPQDAAWWRRVHPDLLLRTASGAPRIDPGWPGEVILDTSTAARRTAVAQVIGRTVATCARKGFDAVEFDNLDSWTRSHGALTRADALATARLLVDAAHRHGLAAAQKNAAEVSALARRTAHFDLAVAEECMQYDECGSYTRVYGQRVIDVEYTDELRHPFTEVCAAASRPRMTVLRDRELVAPSDPAYRFAHC